MSEFSKNGDASPPEPPSAAAGADGPFGPVGSEPPAPQPLSSAMPTRGPRQERASATDANRVADADVEIERLREILLGTQASAVDDIFFMLFDDDRRKTQLSDDLPDAFKMRAQGGEERFRDLVDAVEHSVVASIKKSVAVDRGMMSEALSPMMGGAIIKYLANFNRQITESINEKIEIATSPRKIRWLLEARSKGMDYRDYVHLKTESYEVDEACLIDLRDLSLIQKATVYSEIDAMSLDPTEPSEECRQVQQYLQESREAGIPLRFSDDLRIGNKKVIVIHGATTSLAVMVAGFPTPELEQHLQSYADEMDQIYGRAEGNCEGSFEEVHPILEKCLIRHAGSTQTGPSWGSRIFFTLLALAALAALLLWGVREYRWGQFSKSVRATPGLELLSINRGFGGSSMTGLHDPLQTERSPDQLLVEAGINPDSVESAFTAFQSLDEPFASQREELDNERIRQAVLLAQAGLEEREKALKEDLKHTRKSELAVFEEESKGRIGQRSSEILRSQVGLPQDLQLSVSNQVLYPVGGLEEPGYSQFLAEAPNLTMIDSVDTSQLRDLTRERIDAAKETVESIYIPYVSGTTTPTAKTSQLIAEAGSAIKDIITNAKLKGETMKLTLHALPLYRQSATPDREIERVRLRDVASRLIALGVPASSFRTSVLDSLPSNAPLSQRLGVYMRIELE